MYRLRHKPTGLYFCPSRRVRAPQWDRGYVKSNLSKHGKVYVRKPSFSYLGDWYYNHLEVKPRNPIKIWSTRPNDVLLPVVLDEWEIVEE